MDHELERLKEKKLEEFQKQKKFAEKQENQRANIEFFVKQRLTKKASERLGNIKAVDSSKSDELVHILMKIIQQHNIREINDQELKEILLKLNNKKEIKIRRK